MLKAGGGDPGIRGRVYVGRRPLEGTWLAGTMPGPVRGEKSDAGWGQQQRWLKGCSEDAAFETSRGKSLNEARRPGGWWADALRPLHPVGLSFQGGRFLACLLTRYFFLFQLAAPTATCLAWPISVIPYWPPQSAASWLSSPTAPFEPRRVSERASSSSCPANEQRMRPSSARQT